MRLGSQKGAPAGEAADLAIGRSRGGLTTKIPLAADDRCRPLAFVLTAGQAGDVTAFAEVMARLRVEQLIDGQQPEGSACRPRHSATRTEI